MPLHRKFCPAHNDVSDIMRNGGIIGPRNTPTISVASGVWGLKQAQIAENTGTWPLTFTLYDVQLLVIGGGGSGATPNNTGGGYGGGGAGGYYYEANEEVRHTAVLTITIGAGGAAAGPSYAAGITGADSVVSATAGTDTVTMNGGGGGGRGAESGAQNSRAVHYAVPSQ